MDNLQVKDYSVLELAEWACRAMMKTEAAKLPPVGRFHYHQGVMLLGMEEVFRLTKKQCYRDYMKAWVDSCVDDDGRVRYMEESELDDIQPGNLLFPLYESTGDSRYKKVLDALMKLLEHWPLNAEGGFWHKEMYPDQMWLDGIYMASPIMARYARRFDRPEMFSVIRQQTLLMKKHLTDEKTGLLYHAWDCSKKAPWADPETGRSPEFWGRAIGWYTVAMLEILEQLPMDHPDRSLYIESERDILKALIRYQNEEGLWYQIVDKGDRADNWPELSCTFLYTCSICKAMRMGVVGKEYEAYAKKAMEGIRKQLYFEGDTLMVDGVVIGTGVDDYAYYVAQPTHANDLHGVGTFLLMCAEYHQYFENN